jgi:threonine/homoserine/homoserine lactone efflux protein
MALVLFASALGLGHIVLAQPSLLQIMKWAGGAFLVWFAWKIATSRSSPASGSAPPVGFLGATAFQWFNPKGWLVAVSAAGTFLREGNAPVADALTFGAVFFCAAFPSGLAWLSLGVGLHRLLRNDRTARAFNVAMALALTASVALAFM